MKVKRVSLIADEYVWSRTTRVEQHGTTGVRCDTCRGQCVLMDGLDGGEDMLTDDVRSCCMMIDDLEERRKQTAYFLFKTND